MYVYWWHATELNAIKVGHGTDPKERMATYCTAHQVRGGQLRSYALDGGTDAGWVESRLCRLLEARAFRRVAVRLGGRSHEFYSLAGHTFEDAHQLLHETAHHIALAEASNRRKERVRRERLAADAQARVGQQPQRPPDHAAARQASRARTAERRRRPEAVWPQSKTQSRQRRRRPASFSAHYAASVARLAYRLTALRTVKSLPLRRLLGGNRQPWLYSLGAAAVALFFVLGLAADDTGSGAGTAAPGAFREDDARATAEVGLEQDRRCMLKEVSETLVLASCFNSWALMRWRGRWILDEGQRAAEAMAFFQSSDLARRRADASPSATGRAAHEAGPRGVMPQAGELEAHDPAPPQARETVAPSAAPATEVPQPERTEPDSSQALRPEFARPRASAPGGQPSPPTPAAAAPSRATMPGEAPLRARPDPGERKPPVAEPSQAPPKQAASPRPATPRPEASAPAGSVSDPVERQELSAVPANSRRHCSVSRPKPGLQVYLVRCARSWAMIGHTVDRPNAWTVSEGVNTSEAVEFFMTSGYAR